MFESQNRDCLSPENVGAGGGRVLDRESKKESTREIECEKLTRVQTRSPRQAYPALQYFGSSEDNYSVCVFLFQEERDQRNFRGFISIGARLGLTGTRRGGAVPAILVRKCVAFHERRINTGESTLQLLVVAVRIFGLVHQLRHA